MILSDRSINEAIASGRLGIDPFDPKLIQPSSIDVRLDNKFLVFRNTKRAFIDVKQPAEDLMEMIEVGADEPMFLHPHEFVLGSTIERVRMPDDLVARLEGRSSLGRLGVVIHSSLPYDSPVVFQDEDGSVAQRPIGELVENRVRGRVVAFDRDTFEVGFHQVTNWFRELPDRIYEVRLESGRKVHVTAGHNLFTLSPAGNLEKTPTRSLQTGTLVALPKRIPDSTDGKPVYDLLNLLSRSIKDDLLCKGPTVDRLLQEQTAEVRGLLREAGLSVTHCERTRQMPFAVLERLRDGLPKFEGSDRFRVRGERTWLPAILEVDRELAWLLGLYVAEGSHRGKRIVIASTDAAILDRAQAAFRGLAIEVSRGRGAVTCCSRLMSGLIEGLAMGSTAPTKRLTVGSLGWPRRLVEALLAGLIGCGDSMSPERECIGTTSSELVSDVLLACARMGQRAVAEVPTTGQKQGPPRYMVSITRNRQTVLSSGSNPCELPANVRERIGRLQRDLSSASGFTGPTSLNTDEKHLYQSAVQIGTLEPRHCANMLLVPGVSNAIDRLNRLVNGDLVWDRVVEVVDTGRFEVVYDLEVRSPTRSVQNFLAGYGGVFVSNTAGFIDPAFEGHVTLEISNLANLPIALYPGMRIGQLSFSLMTTPAERPYGPGRGSKYSGQDVPTASRLYLDFRTPG